VAQKFETVILTVVDMLPVGLLLVGRSGNVLAANRMGRQTLDHGGAISECGGVVTLNPATHNHRLQNLLQCAGTGDCSQAALRVPRRSGKPLLIMFVPVGEKAGREREDSPLALLIMNGLASRPDPALLADFFGFTPAESRVASLLMQGKTVFDVAKSLFITENTIRNHLKHMYAKTMTRKQSELVHTLLSSPAGLLVSSASQEEISEASGHHHSRAATSR
jgi:DNA-binding CsgD family transcriptional regulator